MKKPKNVYRIEEPDGEVREMRRDRLNRLVVAERAEWIGTDFDEDLNAYVHYARRVA